MLAQPFQEHTRIVGVEQDGVYPLHIFDSWNEDAECNQMSSLTILGNRHPPVHVEVVK